MNRLKQILSEVSTETGIPAEKIVGKRRTAPVSQARRELYKRYRAEGLSYSEIGRQLGRHHSTIMYGVREMKSERGEIVTIILISLAVGLLAGFGTVEYQIAREKAETERKKAALQVDQNINWEAQDYELK